MNKKLKRLTLAVMLSALGIIIPIIMPKIRISDAASYTLASHVPLFIACFIGYDITILVGLFIGIGFFISTTPVIAVRAFSHLLWAIPLAFILKKDKEKIFNLKYNIIICIIVSLFHALFECLVVIPFYTTKLNLNYIIFSIILPIGLGGFIHSIIDYIISIFIYKRLFNNINKVLN